MITIQASGNCNFAYVTGLRNYTGVPQDAMAELLTTPHNHYSYYSTVAKPAGPPTFRKPMNGFYLFAQGSEDNTKNDPYAPDFKAFIEREGLGEVHAHTAKNPQHSGKTGILYVWTINHDACATWWKKNVQAKHKKSADIKKEIK